MVIVMPLQDKSIEFILHKKERRIEDNSMTFKISIFLRRNYIFNKQLLQYKGLVGRIKREKEDLYIKQKDKNKSLIIYTRTGDYTILTQDKLVHNLVLTNKKPSFSHLF